MIVAAKKKKYIYKFDKMVSVWTWFRYISHKFDYSFCLALSSSKNPSRVQIPGREFGGAVWRNFLHGKMTYLHRHQGGEMAPTIRSDCQTLLVRRIPIAVPFRVSARFGSLFNSESGEARKLPIWEFEMVSIGDIVVMKDPVNPESYLVRRVAAVGGDEMVSTDEKEEGFFLKQEECWVLSDNEALKPKEAKDSRTLGPVQMSNIMGRVIYAMRNSVDHGPVQNSSVSMREDSSVLEVELDVEEMAKNHKE